MISIQTITDFLKINQKELSNEEKAQLNSIFEQADTESDNNIKREGSNKVGDNFLNAKEWGVFKTLLNASIQLRNKLSEFLSIQDRIITNKNNPKEEFDYFSDNRKIDWEKYSEESLKKAFPNCEIKSIKNSNGEIVTVTDKQENLVLKLIEENCVATIIYEKDNESIIMQYDAFGDLETVTGKEKIDRYELGKKKSSENNATVVYYDDNENISKIESKGENKGCFYYTDNKLSYKVNKDTGEKFKLLRDGTLEKTYDGKTIAELYTNGKVSVDTLKNLSTEEYQEFFKNFSMKNSNISKEEMEQIYSLQLNFIKEKGGMTADLESYMSTILSYDFEVDRTVYEAFQSHLRERMKALEKGETRPLKEPNGKIDANFEQGYTGDCWLLSAIKTIALKEKGLEKLNSMISIQKDDDKLISVTVKLQGKDYVISSEELHSTVEYSTGDLDVRALEIAVNRYCIENGYFDITLGAPIDDGFDILLGNGERDRTFSLISTDNRINNEFMQNIKSKKSIGIISTNKDEKYAIDTSSNEKVKIITEHAYAISHCDKDFIYIINPHDTSKVLKVKYNDIQDTFNRGFAYKL